MISPKEKEAEFINDLAEYMRLAIDDKDTDGDRVVGFTIAVLEKVQLINTKRVSNFLTTARRLYADKEDK